MTAPYYADDWLTVYAGDCLTVMAELPSDSVDCVVTSPPYWGLRDYGHDEQLGLERTPEEYVANMVAVFAEVRRVLKPSGTCWLNLGDSYAGTAGDRNATPSAKRRASAGQGTDGRFRFSARNQERLPQRKKSMDQFPGMKPKDLVGIPWMVALALRGEGWYLRSDIIWSKPNPMPESVTDRPTKAHEYLFLLSKSARYYYDADAVREAAVRPGDVQTFGGAKARDAEPIPIDDPRYRNGKEQWGRTIVSGENGRNLRSVWTIATRPYPGAHFAVFPPELPERCIKAGSSERGVCPECGAPWVRVVERTKREGFRRVEIVPPDGLQPGNTNGQFDKHGDGLNAYVNTTIGWAPPGRAKPGTYEAEAHAIPHSGRRGPKQNFGSGRPPSTTWDGGCKHSKDPIPATILDPFAGSGTVGLVANRLSRRAILIDLNPAYIEQQMRRNAQVPVGL